ncbi:hypothetical protein A3Q56_04277 [Intoshia linei]|uniref:EF-hand domain-containing protein n=1 Tax=Intoshia linei TaxID=1819745 RepID=A0A177B155_9BILA|nr:hypothetical protein A3Q56_04277 [Intoshia linei]
MFNPNNITDQDLFNQEFKCVFALFDKNDDDTIDRQSISLLIRYFGLYPTEQEMQQILNCFDGKERINIQIVYDLINEQKCLQGSVNELTEAFHTFDKNKTGLFGLSEVRRSLTKYMEKLSDEEFDYFFATLEPDSNGLVSYQSIIDKLTRIYVERH